MRRFRGRGRDSTRWRRTTNAVLAGVLGLAAVLAGAAGLLTGLGEERLLHRIHDVAPSLALLFVVVPGCAALLVTRGSSIAGLQQVAAGIVGIALGWVLGWWIVPAVAGVLVVLGVLLALLVALHPRRGQLLALPPATRSVVGPIALAVAAGLLWYALDQAALQRAVDPANPHAAEGHYAGMASAAVAFALLALLAAARTEGGRLAAWSAGLGIAALGLLSVAWPLLAGSFPAPWGLAAAAAGAALVVAAEVEARWAGDDDALARPGAGDDALDVVG